MRTAIRLLPAINSLYSLNLTPKDIEDLSTVINSFINEFKSNKESPVLDFDSDLRTLSYVVRRDNSLYYALPQHSARSDNDQIEIKRYYDTDPAKITALDNMIADGDRAFVITIKERYSDNRFILLNNLTQTDLPQIAVLQKFLSKIDDESLCKAIDGYITLGASVVGSCCGSTPNTVRKISNMIQKL